MNDKEYVLSEVAFLERNLDIIAGFAAGNFIDPKKRPKSDRKTWTKESYTRGMNAHILWLRDDTKTDWQYKRRRVMGLREFVLQAINNEFTRYRDIWYMTMPTADYDPPSAIEKRRRERRDRRELLKNQNVLEDNDPSCIQCGLPIDNLTLSNNYNDGKLKSKRPLCECPASTRILEQRKEIRTKRRKEWAEQEDRLMAKYDKYERSCKQRSKEPKSYEEWKEEQK